MNKKKLFIAVLILVTSNISFAYPRADPNVYDNGNLWSITFHDDDSVGHNQWATQNICFSPYTLPGAGQTHIRGKWYSTTFPNWNGFYRQEGDEVKLIGNYANGVGNDGISFDIVTGQPSTVGAGHWAEWRDSGVTSPFYVFGNTLLKRIGKCKTGTSTFDETSLSRSVAPRYLLKGTVAQFPLEKDQEPLKGVNILEELSPLQ